jgi:hypothetical protein
MAFASGRVTFAAMLANVLTMELDREHSFMRTLAEKDVSHGIAPEVAFAPLLWSLATFGAQRKDTLARAKSGESTTTNAAPSIPATREDIEAALMAKLKGPSTLGMTESTTEAPHETSAQTVSDAIASGRVVTRGKVAA